ncbi:MAG: PH domain-containing protein [Prolixibacteraceae bacterium]
MENFTNSVILPENLPELKPADFRGLHRNYLTILFVRIAVVFLFLAGGFVVFFLFAKENFASYVFYLVAAGIVFITAYLVVVTILGFPRKGYLLREKDVSYQHGLITHTVTSVPLNRIQHVEVSQGVLAKILNLSAVKIYTAGGTSSDLFIPGLQTDEAQKLKHFLSDKINEHE